eukprot:g19502.t1
MDTARQSHNSVPRGCSIAIRAILSLIYLLLLFLSVRVDEVLDCQHHRVLSCLELSRCLISSSPPNTSNPGSFIPNQLQRHGNEVHSNTRINIPTVVPVPELVEGVRSNLSRASCEVVEKMCHRAALLSADTVQVPMVPAKDKRELVANK